MGGGGASRPWFLLRFRGLVFPGLCACVAVGRVGVFCLVWLLRAVGLAAVACVRPPRGVCCVLGVGGVLFWVVGLLVGPPLGVSLLGFPPASLGEGVCLSASLFFALGAVADIVRRLLLA